MRPTIQILEPAQIAAVLDEAKRIMAEVGMDIRGAKLRQRLLDAGLPTDPKGRILFPRVAGSTREEANRLTAQVCRHTMLLTAAACFVLYLVGSWAVPFVFGEAFRGSVMPMNLLLPGVLASVLNRVLSKYLSGIGKPSRSRKARSSSRSSFFIWWVTFLASKPSPSAQPLTVCARMTVGRPRCSTAAL